MGEGGHWGGLPATTLLACRRLPCRAPRAVVDEARRMLPALGAACAELANAHLVTADEILIAKLGGRSYSPRAQRARTTATASALRHRRRRRDRLGRGGERARARQLRADERGVAPPALEIGRQVVSRWAAEPRTPRAGAFGEIAGEIVWKIAGQIAGQIVSAAGRAIGAAARRAVRRGAARAARRIIVIGIVIIVAVVAGARAPFAGLLVLAAGPLGRRLWRAGRAVGGGRRAQAAARRVKHIAAHRVVRLCCLKRNRFLSLKLLA